MSDCKSTTIKTRIASSRLEILAHEVRGELGGNVDTRRKRRCGASRHGGRLRLWELVLHGICSLHHRRRWRLVVAGGLLTVRVVISRY